MDTIGSTERWNPRGRERELRTSGRRLHGAVEHKIGFDIVTGKHPPGTLLAGEVAFAEELEISRSAYREALCVLASKGLIESRPRTGTRVLGRERWNILDPDVLAWAFSGEPDLELVKDLFELRKMIEPAAAGLAASRRSAADLQAIEGALKVMRENGPNCPIGRAADRDFHHAILRATRNCALMALSAGIVAAVDWTTRFKQEAPLLPRNAIPDHARVFEAIAAADPEQATVRMRHLVELALTDTRNAMEARVRR